MGKHDGTPQAEDHVLWAEGRPGSSLELWCNAPCCGWRRPSGGITAEILADVQALHRKEVLARG